MEERRKEMLKGQRERKPNSWKRMKRYKRKKFIQKDLVENDFCKSATKDNSNEVSSDIKKEKEKFGKCAWTAERPY